MAKRSPSRPKIDDLAFPIRLKFVVPGSGMTWTMDMRDWLDTELSPDRWAWSSASSSACLHATAYHFRSLSEAQRFLDAFPQLELADGVDALGYPSVKGSRDMGRMDAAHIAVPPTGRR